MPVGAIPTSVNGLRDFRPELRFITKAVCFPHRWDPQEGLGQGVPLIPR